MPNLITRDELKAALGIPANQTADHPNLDRIIAASSAAVEVWTDRDFGASLVTEQRTYEYDGSGYLDIDDAAAVTAVTTSFAGTDSLVPSDLWRAQPYGAPVLTELLLPGFYGGVSPEMGFARNMDVLAREGRLQTLPLLVKVDATWGWPIVPEDVKQAVIWTAASMKEQPTPYVQESIEGYSRSTNIRAPSTSLPDRAKDLLAPYMRMNV
jgi:hypothetical protein